MEIISKQTLTSTRAKEQRISVRLDNGTTISLIAPAEVLAVLDDTSEEHRKALLNMIVQDFAEYHGGTTFEQAAEQADKIVDEQHGKEPPEVQHILRMLYNSCVSNADAVGKCAVDIALTTDNEQRQVQKNNLLKAVQLYQQNRFNR